MGECYRVKDGKKIGKGGRYVRGPPRTLRRIQECYEAWMAETGGDRNQLAKYFNCQHPPTDLFPESMMDMEIIRICPPPPLHIFLGRPSK